MFSFDLDEVTINHRNKYNLYANIERYKNYSNII